MLNYFSRRVLFLFLLLAVGGLFSAYRQVAGASTDIQLSPPRKLRATYNEHPTVIHLTWDHPMIREFRELLTFEIYRAEDQDTTKMNLVGIASKDRRGIYRDQYELNKNTGQLAAGSIKRNTDYYYAVKLRKKGVAEPSPFSNIAKGRLRSVGLPGRDSLLLQDSTVFPLDSIHTTLDSLKKE